MPTSVKLACPKCKSTEVSLPEVFVKPIEGLREQPDPPMIFQCDGCFILFSLEQAFLDWEYF